MSDFVEKTARDLSFADVLRDCAAACFNQEAVHALCSWLPLEDRAMASERHALVAEAMALDASGETLPMRSFEDPGELFESLSRGGLASGRQLRDLSRMLRVAEALRKHLERHADACPKSKRRFWSEPELSEVERAIDRAIDDDGEILDSASSGLGAARSRLQKTRRELRDRQQALVSTYSELLSGQFFAERDGRCVLPVRSDAMGRIDGLVMGSSSSGQTLYVEPRELTELGNRLRIDEARVLEEEEKVLWELCTAVAARLDAVRHASRVCIEADITRSIATWAARHDALPVDFAEEPELCLRAFRHPLLLSREHEVVPNDISLAAGHCLVISGPNAGGKTVALKCLGLCVWMSRTGLPLPWAEGSRIGWFDRVITDIGDEQSMSRSLSTFSAHMSHIARALEAATSRSLVLLDELASGTDPDEGAALAAALLHAFVERGAAVCTTTHYERLKQLGASDDERFDNASVGFDVARLRPTFRLALGVPGMSAAFAVAARYGIPESVVERGKQLIPRTQIEQQRVVERLEHERQLLSQAREVSEREAHAALRLREQMQRERERAYEQEKQRLQKQAADLMQEVKQARGLLGNARRVLAENKPDKQLLLEVEALISEAAAPVTLGGSFGQALARDGDPVPAPEQLAAGKVVFIPHLGARAQVVEPPGKGGVRVMIGGLKMLVPLDKLRDTPASRPKPSPRARKTQSHEEQREVPVRTSDNTCDLRGVRIEAGLEQLDQFIDRLFRVGEFAGFVLHGHGTGAMKAAVREHLEASGHVAHCEPASKDDGGDALTVLWLRG